MYEAAKQLGTGFKLAMAPEYMVQPFVVDEGQVKAVKPAAVKESGVTLSVEGLATATYLSLIHI